MVRHCFPIQCDDFLWSLNWGSIYIIFLQFYSISMKSKWNLFQETSKQPVFTNTIDDDQESGCIRVRTPTRALKSAILFFFGLLELQHFSLTLYYYFGTHYFRNNLIKFLRGLFKSIDFFCSFLGSMFLFQFVSIYIKSI